MGDQSRMAGMHSGIGMASGIVEMINRIDGTMQESGSEKPISSGRSGLESASRKSTSVNESRSRSGKSGSENEIEDAGSVPR